MHICICIYMYYIYVHVYPATSSWERERARLHCPPPVPSNPVKSNQQLLLQIAIYLYCRVHLALLHHLKGVGLPCHRSPQVATDRHRLANLLAPDNLKSSWNHGNHLKSTGNRRKQLPSARVCFCMHLYGTICNHLYVSIWNHMQLSVPKTHASTCPRVQN